MQCVDETSWVWYNCWPQLTVIAEPAYILGIARRMGNGGNRVHRHSTCAKRSHKVSRSKVAYVQKVLCLTRWHRTSRTTLCRWWSLTGKRLAKCRKHGIFYKKWTVSEDLGCGMVGWSCWSIVGVEQIPSPHVARWTSYKRDTWFMHCMHRRMKRKRKMEPPGMSEVSSFNGARSEGWVRGT